MEASFSRDGPFFNGEAERAVNSAVNEFLDRAGRESVFEVYRVLDSSLKHPTGRYRRQINAEKRGNQVVTNDRGIVYGPWLEGVGSRNRTTRFKGYWHFRRATQVIENRAAQIAEESVAKYRVRMG